LLRQRPVTEDADWKDKDLESPCAYRP